MESSSPTNAAECCRCCRPSLLDGTERDSGDIAAEFSRQINRRATHAAADIKHSLAFADRSFASQCVDEMDLRSQRRITSLKTIYRARKDRDGCAVPSVVDRTRSSGRNETGCRASGRREQKSSSGLLGIFSQWLFRTHPQVTEDRQFVRDADRSECG